MKVYAIFTYDFDGQNLRGCLYDSIEKARVAAKEYIQDLQNHVDEMRSFQKEEGYYEGDDKTEYKDVIPHEKRENEWYGGYMYNDGVLITSLEVI